MSSIIENLPIINGNMVKILETPQGYFFNGVYHSKATLQAQPGGIYPILGHWNHITTYKNFSEVPLYLLGRTLKSWILDKDDPSIAYVASQGTFVGNSGLYIYKVQEKDGQLIDFQVSGDLYANVGGNRAIIRGFVTQTDTSIFADVMTNVGSSSTAGHVYLLRLNKTNLRDVSPFLLSYTGYPIHLHESDDFIYLVDNRQGSGATKDIRRVTKTDIAPLTARMAGTIPRLNTKSDCGENIHIEETSPGMKVAYSLRATTGLPNEFNFCKFTIDISRDDQNAISGVVEDIETDVPFFSQTGDYIRMMHIKKFVREERTFFLVYTEQPSSNAPNPAGFGVSLYEALNFGKEGESFKLIQKFEEFEPTSVIISTLLNIDEDYNRLLVLTRSGLLFYKWDNSSEKYILTETKLTPYNSVGVTSEQVVIASTINGNVSVMNPVALSRIDLQMDQTKFQFSNKPIETNCRVAAYNLDNEMISKNIRLTCTTGAKFALTDSRTIDVLTNVDEYVEVKVIITSGTNFTIMTAPAL